MVPWRIRSRNLFPRILALLFLLATLIGPAHQLGRPGAVYHVDPEGNDRNPGTAERPWRHIEWAMTRPFLRGGDTIRIRPGVYRPVAEANPNRDSQTDDTLIRPVASGEPGRPITVTGEPGDAVVLSGRFPAASWESAGGRAPLYFHEYSTPLIYPFEHPFQVVEDGRLLYRVSSLEGVDRPGRCFVDSGARRIYVWTTDGLAPSAHRMEYSGSVSGIEFRSGVEHWRLAGFAVTGFRTTGVMIAGRTGHIELDRMDISYIGAHRPGADLSSGHAIAVYDTAGGNHVHDCNLHHTLAETVHISQTGAGGDLYENNEIRWAGGAEWFHEGHNGRTPTGTGLILRGDRVTVRGNRFCGNGYHGLVLESDLRGSEGPASPSQNIIEGNVFALNAGNGLYGDGKNGFTPAAGNIIRFNLFDRNNQARAGSGDGELRLAGNLDDTVVYNNTFYTDTANGVLLLTVRLADGAAQGADAVPDRVRLVNNIVVHAGRVRRTYALRVVDAARDLVADYNNWYRPEGAPLVEWNGAEVASLEELRSKTGQERRGLSLDPRFVSIENGHFWLRAISPMIGRGLADVREDGTLWAAPQSRVAPDLGAFPYRALLSVSPPELRFVALAGSRDPPSQTITIRSAGEMPLPWTARTTGEGWLALTATAGETPTRLGISVRATLLPAGAHAAMIRIAPALEGEPPLDVRVLVEVLLAPPRRR